MLAVTGEFEDGVNHVFEQFWSGDGAFFGDVADDDDGDVGFFGGLDQEAGTVADLAWGSCCGGVVVSGDALNTVDNAEANGRWHMANGGDDLFQGGGVEKLDVVTDSNLLRVICCAVIFLFCGIGSN